MNSNFPDKPRPLKFVLSNTLEVFKILCSQAFLRNSLSRTYLYIRIAFDHTSIKRDHLKKLREELQKQRYESEHNLTIKYIKGIPNTPSQQNSKLLNKFQLDYLIYVFYYQND